ncbi:neurotrophin 1-like isoform X2 [Cotesia glomerata]|uniref:neurotrophin 1-like isoform X2 n=1 Tax=Cotesia glomerata TaxID=32391 RepID=UPI001D02BD76|nr:neurotrophin 1-like isoform X2 [Cotesia glomerata]
MVLRVLLLVFCVLEVTKFMNSFPTQLKLDGNVTFKGSKNESVASDLDGSKKIFHYKDGKNDNSSMTLLPKCDEQEFCEEVPDYPIEIVEKALRSKKSLELLNTKDKPLDPKPKFGNDESDGLCKGVSKYIIPRAARNKDGETKFIINTKEYVQGMNVETCENVDIPCRLIDGFAAGYKTMCVQKFMYKKLVSLSDVGEAETDWFSMPASCCCKIEFTGNDNSYRSKLN